MVLFLVGQQRAAVMDFSHSTSYSELSALRNLLAEDSRVLEDVSKRMYFDAQLETIARTQYTDYAQVVAAYRSCTILNEYEDYYSGTISSISIYLDNATFTGNSQLPQATITSPPIPMAAISTSRKAIPSGTPAGSLFRQNLTNMPAAMAWAIRSSTAQKMA